MFPCKFHEIILQSMVFILQFSLIMLQDKPDQKQKFHQHCKSGKHNGNSGQIGCTYLH